MKLIEHAEIKLELGGMFFTWDDEKEKINIRKHKIDFKAAAAVFLDKDYVERITTGGNDIIRILSARLADRKEKKRYVNGY